MTPKEMLASDAPKCGNCRHMRLVRPQGTQGPNAFGKGACQEPSVALASMTLFLVTDLMLCSAWEPKP